MHKANEQEMTQVTACPDETSLRQSDPKRWRGWHAPWNVFYHTHTHTHTLTHSHKHTFTFSHLEIFVKKFNFKFRANFSAEKFNLTDDYRTKP